MIAYRRFLHWLGRFCGAAVLFAGAVQTEASPASTYEIAIAPFLPVRTTMQNYEPMRAYLEEHLHAPVILVTATNYQVFNERMRQQAYPFVITVANSAYLAWRDHGYQPLLRPQILTRPALVLLKTEDLKSLRGMHPIKIAMPDAQAVVAMQGMEMLRELGLPPGQDVIVRHVGNHASAVNRVIIGEAHAAIVSDRALQQMPPATRDAVHVGMVWEKGAAPGVVYLASPKIPAAKVSAMMHGMQGFLKTEPGRVMMQRLGYGDLVPVTEEELRMVAPYGEQLRKLLGQGNP